MGCKLFFPGRGTAYAKEFEKLFQLLGWIMVFSEWSSELKHVFERKLLEPTELTRKSYAFLIPNYVLPIALLEIVPETGRNAHDPLQLYSSLSGYRRLALDNLVDCLNWPVHPAGKIRLAHTYSLEHFDQRFPRRNCERGSDSA